MALGLGRPDGTGDLLRRKLGSGGIYSNIDRVAQSQRDGQDLDLWLLPQGKRATSRTATLKNQNLNLRFWFFYFEVEILSEFS